MRFLAVGDWGGTPLYPYSSPFQTAVAKQMAHYTEAFNCSFNLALGDNFYLKGVTDVHDKRFIVCNGTIYFSSLLSSFLPSRFPSSIFYFIPPSLIRLLLHILYPLILIFNFFHLVHLRDLVTIQKKETNNESKKQKTIRNKEHLRHVLHM